MLCHADAQHLWATVSWEHAHYVLALGQRSSVAHYPFPAFHLGQPFPLPSTQDIHLWGEEGDEELFLSAPPPHRVLCPLLSIAL